MKIFDAARFLDVRKVMSLDHSTLASKLAAVPVLSSSDIDSLCDEYPHYLSAVTNVPTNELNSMTEDDVCTLLYRQVVLIFVGFSIFCQKNVNQALAKALFPICSHATIFSCVRTSLFNS